MFKQNGVEVYDRQQDLAVDFLFWNNRQMESRWGFDWSTWTWSFVTQRNPDPFSIPFNSAVDDSFNGPLAPENEFKTG